MTPIGWHWDEHLEDHLHVAFTVPGEAIPQGSTRAYVVGGRAVTTSANPRTKQWRVTIADAARAELATRGLQPLLGAVIITINVYVRRPAGHFNKAGSVKPGARRHPTVKPDIDKVARAVLDALTGVAYRDDSQVIRLHIDQSYLNHPTEEPSVHISIGDPEGVWDATLEARRV